MKTFVELLYLMTVVGLLALVGRGWSSPVSPHSSPTNSTTMTTTRKDQESRRASSDSYLSTVMTKSSVSTAPPPSWKVSKDQNLIEPLNKICLTRDDCSPSECCTVGMMRYSIPTCLPLGGLGDSCIPGNSPRNFTLSYPNGEDLEPIDSFRLLCPCSLSLLCDENTNSCA